MTALRHSLELLEKTGEAVQKFLADRRQFLRAGSQDCYRRRVVRHPCNGSPDNLSPINFVDETQLRKKPDSTSPNHHGLDHTDRVGLHMNLRFLPVAGVLERQRAR